MSSPEQKIEIYGARVHNLENVDVTLPRYSLSVITGFNFSKKANAKNSPSTNFTATQKSRTWTKRIL